MGIPVALIFKAIDLGFAAAEVGVKVHNKVVLWKRKRKIMAEIKKKAKQR